MASTRVSHNASRADTALLVAARDGDEQAFVRLTAPHRRALHVHCYRLLGSLDDADDALQETLLRAWRGLDRFEPRAPISAWLHRIATNVCLRAMEGRRRDVAGIERFLQPYPDGALDEIPDAAPTPEAQALAREGLELAVVATMQLLPPRQRAVLVLRDALGWSAREVADLFQDSVPAVNSALQRARERLARERRAGTLARDHAPASRAAEDGVVRRFVGAWEATDVDGIVALLSDDAVMTMPPESMRVTGPLAIGHFFLTVPMEGRLDRIRLLPAGANGQPALAAYVQADDGAFRPYGLMVLALAGERIAGITGFANLPDFAGAFGLPAALVV